MIDNLPTCPHCNTRITYDDVIDEFLGTSAYEVTWRGTCPICGKRFTWTEIYCYSYLDNFEEEIDNG